VRWGSGARWPTRPPRQCGAGLPVVWIFCGRVIDPASTLFTRWVRRECAGLARRVMSGRGEHIMPQAPGPTAERGKGGGARGRGLRRRLYRTAAAPPALLPRRRPGGGAYPHLPRPSFKRVGRMPGLHGDVAHRPRHRAHRSEQDRGRSVAAFAGPQHERDRRPGRGSCPAGVK